MSEWCTVVETCSSGLGPGQHPHPRARRSVELGHCINMNVWLAIKAIHLRSGDQVSATQPNLIQVRFAPAGGLWKKLISGTLRSGDSRISWKLSETETQGPWGEFVGQDIIVCYNVVCFTGHALKWLNWTEMLHVGIHVCVGACACMCMFVCVSVHICMHVCIHACVCMCMAAWCLCVHHCI